MPPSSPAPLTIRRDEPLLEEVDPDQQWPCPGEVDNWGMFGVIERQELVDGLVHTTVRPRTVHGTAAIESAVHHSPRHTLIAVVPGPA